MMRPKRNFSSCIAYRLMALGAILAWLPATVARAQAPQINQNFQVPKQGGTSTLELPAQPKQPGADALTIPSLPPSQGGNPNQVIPPLNPQTGQELTLPSRQLARQPGYEQVTVTVTNPQHGYETGLTKNDLRLYVDGQQRPIQFFRQDLNTPVSIGILVDTSGSMQPKIPQARAAIMQFLMNLNNSDDLFLFAFSVRPFLLQGFTTNHALIASRLELLHAYGQTALFDAILDGLLMVEHGRYDKKALLVVTDGMDNSSQSSLPQVIAQARRLGVLIYSIGIGDPGGSSMPGLAIGPFIFGGDIDRVDAPTLRMLSTETGARTFIIREVGDGEALRAATTTISHELREQYTVGFTAPDPSAGGYRSLRVDVPTHPDDTVRVRKGVTVGPGSSYASIPPP
ncbi:MAG TPA: VWA domain-containing protein [Candidatus Binataceae bacterium]|nr:VWA domain-containing protein [Candidatus Binataceae bacterium]